MKKKQPQTAQSLIKRDNDYRKRIIKQLGNRNQLEFFTLLFNPLTKGETFSSHFFRLAEFMVSAAAYYSKMIISANVSHQIGTAALLPTVGRLWGCSYHEDRKDGKGNHRCTHSENTGAICLMEHMWVCENYNPDYDMPLYIDLTKGKREVVACIKCGLTFPEPQDTDKLSNLFCVTCLKQLVDYTQEASKEFVALLKTQLLSIESEGKIKLLGANNEGCMDTSKE